MRSMLLIALSALLAPTLAAQTAAPVTPVVVPYAPPASSSVLTSTFVDWDSLIARGTPTGEVRQVFDNPTPTLEKLESHITTLNPGMVSHPVHRHPWEEVIYLREGTLEVAAAGRKLQAGPGALIFLASNDPHNLTNTGITPAIYYIIDFVTDKVHTVADKSAPPGAAPETAQAVPGMLASAVIDCNALPQTSTPTGSRVTVVNSPTLTFDAFESHITTLNPGQSTAKDMLDSGDEVVIIKSGTVEVTVNGVAARMAAGSMVYWVPNDKRTLRNLGSAPASYQVLKVTSAKSPNPPAAVPR